MARVETRAGRPVPSPIALMTGTTVALRIVPVRGELLPFTVAVDGADVASLERVDNRTRLNVCELVLRGRAVGRTLLRITSGNQLLTMPLAVAVSARLELPAADTRAGLLARLLLAETRVPASLDDLPETREAMVLMRVVLENRAARPSARWGSAGARSIADVVRARGQFEGFGGYPALKDSIAANLTELLRIANTASDTRQPRIRAFVEQAIEVASGPAPPDPTRTGLYWWRTAGSGAPGNGVVVHRTLRGNTYYREGP